MSTNDFLLFIDANKYLDLYRIDQGKKLLAPLGEQVDYIFVTQQIVNEVQRNKILVAADFLKEKVKELKLKTFNLPDHLSASIDHRTEILHQMSEISQNIKKVNAEIDALVLSIMEQISRSEDEVSKALSPIFANAILHSSEELQRARERRELGNPPGKITNPIGDQLTWEQILTRFKGKKRLWIISRDGDYGTVYGGKGFVNHFLYNELCSITPEPEVYLFQDIVEGISHFVDTTRVKADNRLTPEEVEEIEREEKSLPNLTQLNKNLLQAIESVRQLSHLNESALSQPNGSVLSQLSESVRQLSQPHKSVLWAIESVRQLNQPSESMQQAIDSLINQPSESIQQAIDSLTQQNEGLLRVFSEAQKKSSQIYQPLENTQEELKEENERPRIFPPSSRESENGEEDLG